MSGWIATSLPDLGSVARRALTVGALGLVMGGAASLAALGFVAAIDWLNDVLWISARSRMMAGSQSWLPLATIAVLTTGGLLVGLINRFLLPDRRAHGPPDVIEAAQTGSGHVGLRTGAGSALASLLSLGSGASVGQYGPLVHLGAALGSVIGRFTPAAGGQALGMIGLGCGVASAIATAFNAPIAGVLFAHEVVLRHYSLRAFAPITVAATIGFVLASMVFERAPLFRIATTPQVEPAEFGAFIVLGLLAALVAIALMRAVFGAARLARHIPVPAVLRPATAGALLGLLALWIPEVLGIGKETLRFAVIPEAFEPFELGLIITAKIAATALCLGFGFAGGIFSPALLIGALFGALMGQAAVVLVPGAADSAGVYAICGMAAVTSPVIGGPITTILIVFELTRNYILTTAVMVSVVFASLVSHRLFGRSMFDETLRARGCDLTLGRDQLVLSQHDIGEHISQDYVRLAPDQPPESARERIAAADETEGHIVDGKGRYCGTVTLAALTRMQSVGGQEATRVDALAVRADAILTEDMNIWDALAQAERGLARELPVLARDTERLVGVIERQSLVGAYREALSDIRREEHATP